MTASPDRRALGVLVLGACVIGAAPILVRLTTTGPVAAGLWRQVFALPILTVLAWVNRPREAAGGRFPFVMASVAGVMFALDLGFWHYSIHFTSLANATVLANLTPVIVTAAAWLLFRERPRGLFLTGLALAVAGAAAMSLARPAVGGDYAHPRLGDALALATTVWYAAYFLAVREARRTAGAFVLMLWSSAAGVPLLLATAFALREVLVPASTLGWAACIGLGLIQVAGQGAIAWALGRLPTSLAAVVVLVQPVVTAALGWVIFGESITALQALGAGVALGGVVLAQASARQPPVAPETQS